jgi:hypothetical protein
MGDGRYYSLSQFFSIIYLTLLIIFMTMTFMLYIYKGKKKSILVLYFVLEISIFLRFVETIVVSINAINLCKVLNNIFLGTFILFYIYLLLDIRKFIAKKILILLTVFLSLSYVLLIFNFNYIIITYILLAINLNVLANYFIPYRVTTSIFGDIKELILDYVFIVDDNRKIIYKNNSISNSDIFNKIDNIDIREIEKIFANSVTIRKAYDKSFIKILDCDLYFQYSKKAIMNKSNIAGYIITFTDITDLINMLDNLKLKQEQTNNINIQLALYKEIVYDKEKEREINILLEKIANNQQQSMQVLREEIIHLSENIDDDFNANIQKTIEKAKKDLFDVRSAVTEYINYYDNKVNTESKWRVEND